QGQVRWSRTVTCIHVEGRTITIDQIVLKNHVSYPGRFMTRRALDSYCPGAHEWFYTCFGKMFGLRPSTLGHASLKMTLLQPDNIDTFIHTMHLSFMLIVQASFYSTTRQSTIVLGRRRIQRCARQR